tara:strand:- start:164 stop:568 length:405 start_codon:yes stop_codon:yes gene_type:complete
MAKKVIDRIEELISYYDLSYNGFDKKVGLSNGYIGRQIKNNANLGSHILEKIYATFDEVSGDWLLGADVPILKKELYKVYKNPHISEEPAEKYKVLSNFEKGFLDCLQKEPFREYIKTIILEEEGQKETENSQS